MIITNLMCYFDEDEAAMLPMSPIEKHIFKVLRNDVDEAYEDYEEISRQNREKANKRWREKDAAASHSMPEHAAASHSMPEHAGDAEGRREKAEGRRKKEEGRVQKEEERGESAEVENGHTKQLFIPPSVEEVAAYCAERKNGIQAQRFVDFYAAKGWRIGKEAMHDWRAAVRIWEGKEAQDHAGLSGHAQERAEEIRFDISYDVG